MSAVTEFAQGTEIAPGTSGTTSPTSMQSSNKAVDKSSPQRNKSKGKNKKGSPGPAKRSKRAANGRQQRWQNPPTGHKGINVTYLTENCDPAKVLWRAIHLDKDVVMPRSVKEIISHQRLPGTLLAIADGRSRIDVLQAACRLGVDFTKITDKGSSWNVIHAAVSSGSVEVLSCLVKDLKKEELDVLINQYSALLGTTQWTPLLIAVKNGFTESVPLLLAHGADPMLPVHLVTPDVINKKSGLNVNRKEGCVYPIFFAVKNCPVSVVKALYKKMMTCRELNVDQITDSKNRTMMHYLSERTSTATGNTDEIFKYLLSLNRDFLHLSDIGGNSPLHEAARRGLDNQASNFITLLESAGVDMKEAANRLNKDDISPLVLAVATGIPLTSSRLMAYNEALSEIRDEDKSSYAKDIEKALDRQELTHAVNLVTMHTTKMDDFEVGTLNTLIALTQDPEQTQLVRAVKRLGALTCMQFITDFTQSQFSPTDPSKFRKEGKPRTKGGHFFTLLKNRLLREERHDDWLYIRVLSELTHKKMRGRPRKVVAKSDYAKTMKPVNRPAL